MADATTVQGSAVIWSYSTDSGSTYKAVVCQQSLTVDRSRNITAEETSCGTYKSVGIDNTKITFSGVMDSAPDTGEGSHTELTALYDAGTKFRNKVATVGNEPYLVGDGYIASLALNVDSPSGLVKFSVTVEIDGTVDTTP